MRETSAERLSRLLALVPWLSQHPGVSITEAAENFGVTPQALERDLWLVVCCGLPGHGPDQLIDIQFWEDDGIIDVIDPQTLQRPLRLTPDEAMALLVGLRKLGTVPGDGDGGMVASLTARLEDALGAGIVTSHSVIVMDPVDSDVRAAIAQALDANRTVTLRYVGATTDSVTERVVSPRRLQEYAGREYLVAFCHYADAQRTFRLDRVRTAAVGEPMSDTIHAPGEIGLHSDGSGESSPSPLIAPQDGTVVRLRVDATARWFTESAELLTEVAEPDGSTVVEMVVGDPGWLGRTVVGLGGRVEVIAPIEIRRSVGALAQDLLDRQMAGPDDPLRGQSR